MIKRPRGTRDVLPDETGRWRFVEDAAREICARFAYGELRFPTFEFTELFSRGVGDTTDVVQKEMYTFEDRDRRSVTLRPEGTASAVRALIENGLTGDVMPQKFYYIIPCFRYEKPQAGRLREFHQFGAEVFGAPDPAADAEIISLAHMLFARLGVRGLDLRINSLGCPECRKGYYDKLRAYFEGRRDELCDTCRGRLEKNPMRILDCKSEQCRAVAAGAPSILDSICPECADHFEKVKGYLAAMDIPFAVDDRIVRGLDYYTRTVFEFVSNEIGAQGTVCGGGRYDGLVAELGGKPTAGLGFAMGLERLLLLMEAQGLLPGNDAAGEIYIASMDAESGVEAVRLVHRLRERGISAQCDVVGRSLKAQMKYADKTGARYSMVLGSQELGSRRAKIKDMATGEGEEISLDSLCEYIEEHRK